MSEEAEFQQYAHDPALRRNAGSGLGPAARRGIFGDLPSRSFYDSAKLKKILVGEEDKNDGKGTKGSAE